MMAGRRTMTAKEAPPAAPLFVVALSKDGKRHELLLERGHPSPEWFATVVQIRVQAPSGETKDATFVRRKTDDAYDACLSLLDDRRVWAPRVRSRAPYKMAELELWTLEDAPLAVMDGPILSLRRESDGSGSTSGLTCYAVIRTDNATVWAKSDTGQFYLDLIPLGQGMQLVPRAMLDFGLAGAFWGFTEHHNTPAAMCVARRLLESIVEDASGKRSTAWIVAAAHGILAHQQLMTKYGDKVLAALGQKGVPSPDGAFLKALIGMNRLSGHEQDLKAVKADLRAAIKALAAQRAIFGETVRLLDANFELITHLAIRDLQDGTLKDELAAISAWLGNSFAGGQAAAYFGEAPLEGEGWHDVLAEKKTLKS